jgi:hypothetical protein
MRAVHPELLLLPEAGNTVPSDREAWAPIEKSQRTALGAREVKSSSSTRLPPVPDCQARFADKRQL